MIDEKERIASLLEQDSKYNRPILCPNCQDDIMEFKGSGTYQCPNCKHEALDDWGKVREFLYKHPNATAIDIEEQVGVPRKEVNQMIRESRIVVTNVNRGLLFCDMCGTAIPSGSLCPNCEKILNQRVEKAARNKYMQHRAKSMQGVLIHRNTGEEGRIRYNGMRKAL